MLTWPVIAALRDQMPDHRFVGFGQPERMRLGQHAGLIDDYYDVNSARFLPLFSGKVLPDVLKQVDGGVIWMEKVEGLVRLLSGESRLPVLQIKPFPAISGHIADYYSERVQEAFQVQPENSFQVRLPACRRQQGVVLIHPGSGSPDKNYPPLLYRRLAEFIRQVLNLQTRFVFGPVEREQGVDSSFRGESSIFPDSLLELAEILYSARALIGNDSGVCHLAGALGVHTVAMYRVTDPAIWGVRGKSVLNIQSMDEEMLVENVTRHLQACLSQNELKQRIFPGSESG